MMVMTLCLMVYSFAQHFCVKRLNVLKIIAAQSRLGAQIAWCIKILLMALILKIKFQVVQKLVINLKETTKKVINFFAKKQNGFMVYVKVDDRFEFA